MEWGTGCVERDRRCVCGGVGGVCVCVCVGGVAVMYYMTIICCLFYFAIPKIHNYSIQIRFLTIVPYSVLLDCVSLKHADLIPLFVIHVWHTRFPLNGIKKYLTYTPFY